MSNWKETLAAVAPALATALGGPFAGAATSAISKALLGKDIAPIEDIARAVIGASPEQLMAMQNADKQFSIQMKKLNVEDRKSARKFAIDTSILPQVILSVVYTVGYFSTMYGLFDGALNIPDNIHDLAVSLIGIMTLAQGQILNFWFGSSSGSKEKTSKLVK
jgi:hypothetical protein